MKAMHRTDFAVETRPIGDTGLRRSGVVIRCSACGVSDWVKADSPGFGKRLFSVRGWKVGTSRSADICPSCLAADRVRPPAPPATPSPKAPPVQLTPSFLSEAAEIVTAAPPRVATLADNRRIREAIDAHYDEDAGGWRIAGTDQSVADQLNVPRAWVTAIRELYGPDTNELKKQAAAREAAQRAAAIAQVAEAEGVPQRLLDMAAEAEALVATLRGACLRAAA